ncbi:flagellar filament capping protein FliD [Paenibacillus pasadenensis]|uniref:flagellar filament capping protein FliD n=1 Tax=Paenibacillus pasadenensis TaxID=217090 RepID=UPI00203B49C6|nr:flagellar filament capping protein FliD [Paenibacillus pasadenensis]MCM3750199.1 flagellar filament capping protein FliD [Paenibacillus pasadenensis]
MSNLRISGFNSGLDIDSMVKQLMKAENAKLDKLKASKATITWQQEQYRDISTSLIDFRNNKLAKYNNLSSLSAKTSEVTGNLNAVSVTSTTSAATGSLSVTIESLAKTTNSLYQLSPGSGSPLTSYDNTTLMKDLNLDFDSKDGNGNYTLTINSNGTSETITFDDSSTLGDVLGSINSNKKLNVTAMVGKDGLLSIRSNSTGLNDISVGGAFNMTEKAESTSGGDALYTVNGIAMTSSSNYISVNGYNLQLKEVTSTNNPATITSKMDTSSILNTIKSFVSDYNSILDQVNGKLNEDRYRSFKPLTEEQKQDMKENEITLWENKAKSGLLKNEPILSSMISDLRMSVLSTVDTGSSDILNLQSLGIVTGSWNQHGKLIIEDEEKLKAAIEKNPDAVVALFNKKTSTSKEDLAPTSPNSGLFTKLSSTLMTTLQSLSQKAGTSAFSSDKNAAFMANSMLGEQLRDLDKRIDSMNSYLFNKENQYYKQFTAMETAINRYSSQSSAFSSN